jgi:hypothetical protein
MLLNNTFWFIFFLIFLFLHQIILGQIMNRLSCCVLDCHRTPYEKASFGDLLLNSVKLGEMNFIALVFEN